MHGSNATGSQMAICTAKAKQMTNGSSNRKEDEKSTLIQLLRQNSICDICRKCISEKKKLVAHRKICLLKFNKKTSDADADPEFTSSSNDDDADEVDFDEDTTTNCSVLSEKNQQIVHRHSSTQASSLSIEKLIGTKKKKIIRKSESSIELNFLFE